MASIRRIGRTLVMATALSLPGLALAEQPTELCDGEKGHEEPTADKSDAQQKGDKASKKAEDKTEPKRDTKEADKPADSV